MMMFKFFRVPLTPATVVSVFGQDVVCTEEEDADLQRYQYKSAYKSISCLW
jgi:hypothetical protein